MITNEMLRKRLQEALRLSGWKQKKLAEQLHISQAMVSSYLTKDKMPSLETFANICRVLDLDPYDMLCLKKSV